MASSSTGIERLVNRFRQTHRNHAEYGTDMSAEGKLLVDFSYNADDGMRFFRIGNIVDSDYFSEEWFSGPELEISAKFEDTTQQIIKESSPRVYSGLWPYSHTERVARTAFKLAKQSEVPLDFVILLTIIGHDRIEDHPAVRGLYNKWKQAINEGNHEMRAVLEENLGKERISQRHKLVEELFGYMSQISGVDSSERVDLRRDIEASARLISNLTRFSDRKYYASSMDYQYGKHGNENIENSLRRIFVKNCDRIANLNEFGPLFPDWVMRHLEAAFNAKAVVDGYVVGEELRRRFGEVRAGREMPDSVKVQTSAKSIYNLQNQNEFSNRYGADIEAGSYGKRPKELLSLMDLSKKDLIESTLKLVNHAITSYESNRNVRNIKLGVDAEIEALRGTTFYDRATLGGVVEFWLLMDPKERSYIESLDNTPAERNEIYRTARHIKEMLPRFRMFYDPNKSNHNGTSRVLLDKPELYDSNIHRYFTLDNFDKLMALMPDILELKRPSTV